MLHAAIQLPGVEADRQPVHVFCTHLTNGGADINRGQAAALQEFVAYYPGGLALIAGDFNASEASPQFVQLSRLWVDAFRAVHPTQPGLTCCVDPFAVQDVQGPQERIDYVFLRPEPAREVRIVDCKVVFNQPFASPSDDSPGSLWASDHTGVLVVIEYP